MHALNKSFRSAFPELGRHEARRGQSWRKGRASLLNLPRRHQIYVVVFSAVTHRLVSEQSLSVCQYPNLNLPELKSGTEGEQDLLVPVE